MGASAIAGYSRRMLVANRTSGTVRAACGVAALVGALASAALAGPDEFRARASAALPLGSFESAGIAVFVRAHEARRQVAVPVTPTGSLAYEPVASTVSLGALDTGGRPEIDLPATTGSAAAGSRWVAPSDGPTRPGALPARDSVEAASPFAKQGLINPYTTPDLEVEVSKRARLGVFGEANKIEPTDIRNATTRSTRDLGAGVTLQYRFGE
jgi:hypothetical protein